MCLWVRACVRVCACVGVCVCVCVCVWDRVSEYSMVKQGREETSRCKYIHCPHKMAANTKHRLLPIMGAGPHISMYGMVTVALYGMVPVALYAKLVWSR